jgi:prepilin-type N-terminal cleavage/methylation domain-containing protein
MNRFGEKTEKTSEKQLARNMLCFDYRYRHSTEIKMNKQQSGFTLVEIAIVLVIIGLLLGGVLKGQELINSAKVKNFANDFRNIPLFIYGYQDKFRAIPGDDSRAVTNIGASANGDGNGRIGGTWDSTNGADESVLFWEHVRKANLAAGPTALSAVASVTDFLPKNAEGGIIGIQSGVTPPITGMVGSYIVCSQGILGKFVKQLDITMDDGNTAAGSLQAVATAAAPAAAAAAVGTAAINDATTYTVCLGF